MKRFFGSAGLVALLFGLSIAFQNCGKAYDSATDNSGMTNPIGTYQSIMGQYPPNKISSLKYSHSGGLYQTLPPVLTVTMQNGVPVTGDIVVYDHGTVDCTHSISITQAQANQILSKASQVYFSTVPAGGPQAADCSVGYFSLQMFDTSEHSFFFDSVCAFPGSLVMKDSAGVQNDLNALFTGNTSCP
jgi:hypothetical protein